MSEIRVAFFLDHVAWLGGVNYYRNLFSAIQSVPEVMICPVVITGLTSDISKFEDNVEVIRTSILERYTISWWISKFLIKIFPRRDYLLYLFLRKHRINLISHNCLLWKECKIPSIGWIPDFQHLHLPEFFDKSECEARDHQFMDIISRCKSVILSSQDALNDLNRFYTNKNTSTHILRFVSTPHDTIDTLPNQAELYARYNIDRPWFYLPNQFWAHKNHIAVIDALRLLKEQGDDFLVIATGSTNDSRNEGYYASLMQKVNDYGLNESFRSLGVIPYSDVVALMKYSIAVINPSLFEGWSTSVEESKSLGKMVVLSDIPVHREQKPNRGYYFNPHNPNELANNMKAIMEAFSKEKEFSQYTKAKKQYVLNRKSFAKQFEKICYDVLNK